MKHFLYKTLFFVMMTSMCLANEINSEVVDPLLQTLVNTTIFEGDRDGNFAGDLVATLSDGSAWKIHPKSKKNYESWEEGDLVYIRLRNDDYWFSRKHHFELYNHTRKEFAKAMLLQHKKGSYKLRITTADTYPISQHSYSESLDPLFGQTLILSDGTTWVLQSNTFRIGQPIYVAVQQEGGSFSYILITGTEKTVSFASAIPGK